MENIKLILGNYELAYEESIREYMRIDQSFNNVSSNCMQYLEVNYEKAKCIETVMENFFKIGEVYLEEDIVPVALKIFSEYEIYNINSRQLLNDKRFGKSVIDIWQETVNNLIEEYNKIEGIANSEKFKRQINKDNRIKIIGGGFGIYGAAKGMLTAGAINMLYGAAYNTFNNFENMETDKIANKNKAALYKNKRTLEILKIGMALSLSMLKELVFEILQIKPFSAYNSQNAKSVLENIKCGNINENKIEEALAQAFILNPFSEEAYELYLRKFGDQKKQLEKFADFFNLKDFIKYIKAKIFFELSNCAFNAARPSNPGGIINVLKGVSSPVSAFYGWNESEVINQYTFMINYYNQLGIDGDYNIINSLNLIYQYVVNMNTNNEHKGQNEINNCSTNIKEYSFFSCESINNVFVPGNIRIIGNGAFAGCNNLKSIFLSEGLVEIGDCAFYRTAIEEISIPESVRIIGIEAFADCTNLKKIKLKEGIEEIGHRAFANCIRLQEIELPSSLRVVGDDIFSGNKIVTVRGNIGLEVLKNIKGESRKVLCVDKAKELVKGSTVSIPSHIVAIDKKAFLGNEKIEILKIPSSVIEIGEEAFSRCTNLKKIVFSNGIERIGDGAFFNCEKLEEVILPSSIKEIGDLAFGMNYNLTKIFISEGIEVLSSNFIFDNYKIEKIILPSSLKKIVDDEDGKSGFNSHTRYKFICEKGSYAYDYCVNNGLNIVSDQTEIDSSKKEISNKFDAMAKEEKDQSFAEACGCLFWVGLIIWWIFF